MSLRDHHPFCVILHIAIYLIVITMMVYATFALIEHKARIVKVVKDVSRYATSARTIARLVKGYVLTLARIRVNNLFGFVSLQARPGSGQHLTYTLPSGDTYTISFTKKRIGRVLSVMNNDSGIAVTSDFMKFLGPGNNFYGIPTKPSMIGMGNITVTYVDGTVKTYGPPDIIDV